MIATSELADKLKMHLAAQIDKMASSSPMISFMKPLITRALNKNFGKINKFLEFIADEDGNVDVEGIMTEMMESVMTTKAFKLNTSFIGDIEIGDGLIKMNIPLTSKSLVFNGEDLKSFKELLTVK